MAFDLILSQHISSQSRSCTSSFVRNPEWSLDFNTLYSGACILAIWLPVLCLFAPVTQMQTMTILFNCGILLAALLYTNCDLQAHTVPKLGDKQPTHFGIFWGHVLFLAFIVNLKCASCWPSMFLRTDQDLESRFIYEDVCCKYWKLGRDGRFVCTSYICQLSLILCASPIYIYTYGRSILYQPWWRLLTITSS